MDGREGTQRLHCSAQLTSHHGTRRWRIGLIECLGQLYGQRGLARGDCSNAELLDFGADLVGNHSSPSAG
jgi:hypothetical protein